MTNPEQAQAPKAVGKLGAAQKRIAELEAEVAALRPLVDSYDVSMGPDGAPLITGAHARPDRTSAAAVFADFEALAREIFPGMLASKPQYMEPNAGWNRGPNLLFMQDMFTLYRSWCTFRDAMREMPAAKDFTRDFLPLVCKHWPRFSDTTEAECRQRMLPGEPAQVAAPAQRPDVVRPLSPPARTAPRGPAIDTDPDLAAALVAHGAGAGADEE